jgi:Rrf2 family iron-sulfur cluster assembly transcriptional regulator
MYAYLDSVTLGALVNREIKPDADMAVLKNIRRRATIALREAAAA